jgi:hypothetical protein
MSEIEHQCPYCELRFGYLAEVKDHVMHDHPAHRHVVEGLDPHELPHHGDDAPTGVIHAGHQCPWCELRFAFTTELGEHIAVDHDGHPRIGTPSSNVRTTSPTN